MRRLLLVLGDSIVESVVAPGGLDAELNDVVILDAEDEPDSYAGELVLIIGARGRSAIRLVRSAARHGAAAVAVKVERPDDLDDLKRVAADVKIVVLGVRPEVRWSHLESLARGVVADARMAGGAVDGQPVDLFALAQTLAAMAGGSVSIEDSASRVLAYSQSDDEVDELRRLSILGWQGPADYLALLRQWGVFERLRTSDDVVEIDARPELGINKRLAIGVRVDDQLLGSIWVQEGTRPLVETAASALRGAARTAALQLVRRRTGVTPSLHLEHSLLSWLLEGHIDPQTFADNIGADRGKPAVVTAFALGAGASEGDADRSTFELRKAMMANLVAVNASAYRRSSFVTSSGPRVYMLVPNLVGRSTEDISRGLADEIVRAAGQRLQLDVWAAVGSVVDSLDQVGESKSEADRVLDITVRDGQRKVATIADVRGEVLVRETLALLDATPTLRDPRVSALIAYDAEHQSGLVASLLGYLRMQGNVREAARSLHVHPNTLRYRLKRAESVSGIDLSDPYQCLFTHLQLLLETPAAT